MVWVFILKFGVYIENRTLHCWLEVQNFSQSGSKIFQPLTALSSATFFNTLSQILYFLVITSLDTPRILIKCRVQRKSFLQLAFRASWSYHLPALMSFQPAPKAFWLVELISQLSVIRIISSKNITCPSGKLKTEFTSPER